MDTDLAQQLISMADEDRRVRAELAATGELLQGYAPRMEEVHRRNAQALNAIIDQIGWPGRSLVGEEGANAAWFITQHAIGSPEFQRKCLPLLKQAIATGEAEPAHAAYLEDRICFYERRPQRYGTQFDWDEHRPNVPWRLEDPDRVDEYRRQVGLCPISGKDRGGPDWYGRRNRSRFQYAPGRDAWLGQVRRVAAVTQVERSPASTSTSRRLKTSRRAASDCAVGATAAGAGRGKTGEPCIALK